MPMPWPVVFPVEENTKMSTNQWFLGQEPYVSNFIRLMGTEPLVARQVEELRGKLAWTARS
jgi:hypothetical protein